MESLSPHLIRRVRREPDLARVLVGLETLNGSLILQRRNNAAALPLARTLGMAPVGSSDAHEPALIGACVTRFMGHTSADLRRQLEFGFTQAFSAQPSGASGLLPADWRPRCFAYGADGPRANSAMNSPVRLPHPAPYFSEGP